MSNVQAAIDAAKAAAATMVAQQEPVNQASAGGQEIVAAVMGGVATPMMKPSMSMVQASTSLVPRTAPYVKVNEYGILIGKTDRAFKTEMKAKVLLSEDRGFQLKWTLRFGNPAAYYSTYDGVVCDKGGSWADAQAKVRAIDPRAEPYVTADIIAELIEAVEVTGGKIEAGTKIALNLSKTNFSEWQEFYQSAAEQGLIGQEVEVTLGHRAIAHNGNNWGVITFAVA